MPPNLQQINAVPTRQPIASAVIWVSLALAVACGAILLPPDALARKDSAQSSDIHATTPTSNLRSDEIDSPTPLESERPEPAPAQIGRGWATTTATSTVPAP